MKSWNVLARIVFITIRRTCCGIWMRLACAVRSESLDRIYKILQD